MGDKHRILSVINKICFGNKAEFARLVGISPQSVTNWLNRGVSKDGLLAIYKAFPEINKTWLLTGEGEMLRTDEAAPIGNEINRDQSRLIPFYDAETTGGYQGMVASSDTDAELSGYIQAGGWFDSKETAAIRHIGDSMVEYPSGCVLAVREVTERHLLVPGRNYVIETSEFRVTKRIQRGSTHDKITLYSSNPETYPDGRLVHEPFEVDLADVRKIYSVLGYIVNQSGEFRLIKP